MLRRTLRGPGIEYKYHDAKLTWLEAIFARGDRRLSKVLEFAYEMGARFDAWPNLLDTELWSRAFELSGLDPSFYAHRERKEDEIFPWGHIDTGVTHDYLLNERKLAQKGLLTDDCRTGTCVNCGVCPGLEVKISLK